MLSRDSLGLISMCDTLVTHTTDLITLSDDLLIQRDMDAPHPGNSRLTLSEKGKTRNEDALYFFNLSERLPGYNSMLEKPQSICDSLESQELWHKYRHCFCGLIVRHQQKHTIRG